MAKKKNLVRRLNDAISSSGSAMGPALTSLILYGPTGKEILNKDNLDILESNAETFEDTYRNHIFPKYKGIVRTITKRNSDFPANKTELYGHFVERSPESIRKKFRDSYRGQFELDKTTAQALFSENKIYNVNYKTLKFFFNKGSEDMFSMRYKTPEKIRKKLHTNFEKMTRAEKNNSLNFVVDVAENDYASWSNYDKYSKKYSKEVLDMILGDLAGIKIVDLNQERAEKTMEELSKSRKNIDFHNFFSIDKRFYDHRKRNKKNRPGGIHCTLVDKALPNYPLEVQFRSIQDEFFNLFGKYAHYLYSLNGKKSNPATSD
ncbi:MAG: hypothetical protein ABIF18_02985 [archaeon]